MKDLFLIVYMGGSCGDLITMLYDSCNGKINKNRIRSDIRSDSNRIRSDSNRIRLSKDRSRLKKPHLFKNNSEKDHYLIEIAKYYGSIPSHDLAYHIERKHDFIGITVDDFDIAMWAAERFKQLHRPHTWEEMTQVCDATTIKQYAEMYIHFSHLIKQHTDNIIKLEDIVNGKLLDVIEIESYYRSIYTAWLANNNL